MQLTTTAQTFLHSIQNTLSDDVADGTHSTIFAQDVAHCLQYFSKHVKAHAINTSTLVDGIVIEAQTNNYLHVAVYVLQRYTHHLEHKLS